jgi:hypothetical protein
MAVPISVRKWLRLPSRVALILGLGALSTAGAQADTQTSQKSPGDLLVRSNGGKIYLSEGGRETELKLGATPQRDRLLRLLEEHGSAGVKLDSDPRLIMSGGGGAGFSLWDIKKSVTDRAAPAPQDAPQATMPSNSPEPRSAPRKHAPGVDKKG